MHAPGAIALLVLRKTVFDVIVDLKKESLVTILIFIKMEKILR
jgi:hypothetical protein